MKTNKRIKKLENRLEELELIAFLKGKYRPNVSGIIDHGCQAICSECGKRIDADKGRVKVISFQHPKCVGFDEDFARELADIEAEAETDESGFVKMRHHVCANCGIDWGETDQRDDKTLCRYLGIGCGHNSVRWEENDKWVGHRAEVHGESRTSKPQGSYICQGCHKDWGDGKKMFYKYWRHGLIVHCCVQKTRDKLDGCGKDTVKWVGLEEDTHEELMCSSCLDIIHSNEQYNTSKAFYHTRCPMESNVPSPSIVVVSDSKVADLKADMELKERGFTEGAIDSIKRGLNQEGTYDLGSFTSDPTETIVTDGCDSAQIETNPPTKSLMHGSKCLNCGRVNIYDCCDSPNLQHWNNTKETPKPQGHWECMDHGKIRPDEIHRWALGPYHHVMTSDGGIRSCHYVKWVEPEAGTSPVFDVGLDDNMDVGEISLLETPKPHGSWICQECGIDWKDGKDIITTFYSASKEYRYCESGLGGCGARAVKWVEPEVDKQPDTDLDIIDGERRWCNLHDRWADECYAGAGCDTLDDWTWKSYQPETPQEDSEHCQVCGNAYLAIYRVPDEIWNDIKLEGKPEGSGLLCISCADRLARNKGYGLYWSAAEKDFPEPKADNGYSGTGFANLKETTELQAGELQEENQRLRKEMARVRGVIRNTSWDDIDNLRKDIRRKDEELVSLRKKYDDLKSRKVTAREHAEVLQREIKQKDEELEEVRMEVEKLEHSETNLNVLDTLRMELVHARNQSDIMTTVADQLRDSQGCSFESIEKAAKAVGYGPGAVAHILNVLKATPPVVGDKHRQEGEPLIVNTEQTEQLEKLKKDNKDLYNSVDYHLRLKDEHNEILKRLKAKLKALQHQHALVIGDIDGKKHHIGYIENANADLIAEVNKLKNARDNAIMEARGWAIGAKTQRAIVRKVGQIVGLQDWEDIAGAVQKLSDAAMDTPQRRSARKH